MVRLLPVARIPFSLTWFDFITAWRSNYFHYKVWGEIINAFPNFNGARLKFAAVKVWEWRSNFTPTLLACNYSSMPRLKLIHVSKKGPMWLRCSNGN